MNSPSRKASSIRLSRAYRACYRIGEVQFSLVDRTNRRAARPP